MSSIHSYPLPVDNGWFTLSLPAGTTLLHVGIGQGRPTLWVLAGTGPLEKMRFYNAYTGVSGVFLEKMKYLGTVANSWNLVFHYFQMEEK